MLDHGLADDGDQPEPESDEDEHLPARTATDLDGADSDSGSASTSGFDGDIGDRAAQRMGERSFVCHKPVLRSPDRDVVGHAVDFPTLPCVNAPHELCAMCACD